MSETTKPQTFTQPLRQACDPHVGKDGKTISPAPVAPTTAPADAAPATDTPAPAEED